MQSPSPEALKSSVKNGRIRITDHAEEAACADRLTIDQVLASVLGGRVLETYANDQRPLPGWLITGEGVEGTVIHSVWGYNAKNGWAVLIRCVCPVEDFNTPEES